MVVKLVTRMTFAELKSVCMKDLTGVLTPEMWETFLANASSTTGVAANIELADDEKKALSGASKAHGLYHTHDPYLASRKHADNNVAFLTSWVLAANLTMVCCGDTEPVFKFDVDPCFGNFQDADGNIAVTGRATALMASFTSKTGTYDAATGNVVFAAGSKEDPHWHGHDVFAAAKDPSNLLKSDGTGAYKHPSTVNQHVSCAAVLSFCYPIIVVQGAKATLILKKQLTVLGATLLDLDPDLFFDAIGLSSRHCQLSPDVAVWRPFLCVRGGLFCFVFPAPSVSICYGIQADSNVSSARLVIQNVLNACRFLQGLQPNKIANGITMFEGLGLQRQRAAVIKDEDARNKADYMSAGMKGAKSAGASNKLNATNATDGTATCVYCGTPDLLIRFVSDKNKKVQYVGGMRVGKGRFRTETHKCKDGRDGKTSLSNCRAHVKADPAKRAPGRDDTEGSAKKKNKFFHGHQS